MGLTLAGQLRIQARANRLANQRLHSALARLEPAEFDAPRTGSFPSLAATLNHVLAVDEFYVGALHGERELPARYDAFRPARTAAELVPRQRASDERLIDFCGALDAAGCEAMVDIDRRTHIQRDRAAHVLAHLFMHQIHHRGQAHAMLSGSSVRPPQLDEFLMPSEGHLRVAEMAALGWDEAGVYGA